MTKKSMEDIRALIDPEAWLRALREAKTTLEGNLALMFVDYDMTKATPEMGTKARGAALTRSESQIRDCEWRLGEIQNRIDGAADGATGRAGRRARARG